MKRVLFMLWMREFDVFDKVYSRKYKLIDGERISFDKWEWIKNDISPVQGRILYPGRNSTFVIELVKPITLLREKDGLSVPTTIEFYGKLANSIKFIRHMSDEEIEHFEASMAVERLMFDVENPEAF